MVTAVKRPVGETQGKVAEDLTPDNATAPAPTYVILVGRLEAAACGLFQGPVTGGPARFGVWPTRRDGVVLERHGGAGPAGGSGVHVRA